MPARTFDRTPGVILFSCATLLTAGSVLAAVEEIPVSTRSEPARLDFLAGQAAFDRGDAAKANALFRSAVEHDPDFTSGWFYLANASFSTEEFASSLKRAAAAANGTEGERMLVTVGQRFLDNDFTAQLATSKELVEKFPRSPRAWLNLAAVQGGLNQFAEQRASLARAIELDARFTPAYLAMANSYLFNEPRDLKRAEEFFGRTLALAPGEDNYHWLLGDVYRAMNQLEKAREHYKRATLLDPHDGTAPVKLGHVNSFLGRYAEARQDYDRGIANAEVANKPFLANYKMFTWVHAGDAPTAIEALEGVAGQVDSMGLRPDQRDGAANFTLTNALTIALHHNRHDDARRVLDKLAVVLRSNAKSVGTQEFSRIQEAQITYFEGQLAARRGDFRNAQAFAKKNADLVSGQGNPRRLENHHDLMGLIHLLQRRHSQAIEHYRKADLTNQYVQYHYALALEGARQTEEARRIFRQVGEWNFNSVAFALIRKDALARARA
jgi:tetratricopeptide (TPR) repeat protein